MNSDTVGIIQARMGSTRLPGKALKKIGGYSITEFLVRRVESALSEPLLAIPAGKEDDQLAEAAESWPCEVVRGPEEDVLQRFIIALEKRPSAEAVVRITGDNPLLSRRLLWMSAEKFREVDCDWGSFRDVPLGGSTGIFAASWLRRAGEEARDDFDREHVTSWIKGHPDSSACRWEAPAELRAPGLRLTVDTEADLELIRRLVEEDEAPEEVSTAEVVKKLAASPQLIGVNSHIRQKHRQDVSSVLYCLNKGGKWGHGHFSRMKSIARAIETAQKKRNLKFHLLAGGSGDLEHGRLLKKFDQSLADEDIIRWTRRADVNYVILDIKNSSRRLVKTLRNENRCVIGIEDTGAGRGLMDRVVDPNLYHGQLDEDEVPMKMRGYGPRYALVDPNFAKNRRQEPPRSLRDVGLFFGGTDPEGLGMKFISLAEKHPEVTFHLFGPRDDNLEECPDNLNFRGYTEKPWQDFAKMDFMVIGGGNVKFEVAALGLGALIIAQHDEQYDNSKRFIEKNELGWDCFKKDAAPERWEEALLAADDPGRLERWWEKGPEVVDGQGIKRLLADFSEIKV
ncbi:MAG: cytidylyltransferase domain-containing protein [bacterium]